MRKLNEIYKSPTPYDSEKNYCGSIPESCWFVLLGRNRDSDLLTEDNFENAL